MRKVVAATFLSLDGVMQAPGGPEEDPTGGFAFGGWVFPHWDEATGQAIDETFGAPFDLLLGRKTYEIFAAYWPYVGEDDSIGKVFNRVTKYVATRSATPLTWRNSVALHGDAADAVAELKRQDGPTLLLQGSSGLIQSLLARDLIDEFRLMTFPIVLGKGKRLFGPGAIPIGLKLVGSKASTTGVVMSTYVRAGEVAAGSFAQAEPSEAELARRERMKREG
ncbi:dihydrofolate reductase family protein [Inquilinus limosus]|uniref:dihydrofolate reductase family protein n=1 Tax=Inquilinus limosus TaxID=171674 RepID=UPI000424FE4B|nr:dihydrofolate reductase family protein [Inquilinus limosus]